MSCAIKWMQKVSLFDDNCPEYVLYKKSTFFIYITSFILHQLPKLRSRVRIPFSAPKAEEKSDDKG